MPWQECRKVDERMRFVARLLDGEKMAVLCREFDVSRKTGDKIFSRYKDCGLHGLTDRSRRPYRHANRLPLQIESLIVQLKREHPSCGAPQDPREDQASQLGCCAAGHQHRACGARSPWSRHPRSPQLTLHSRGHALTPRPTILMICGVPSTRVSSCSPITATVTR